MQFAGARQQHAFRLEICRIGNAAIYGAYRRARLMVVEADAFGALRRHDVVDVLSDSSARRAVEFPWHPARVDRCVRTLGLARPAIDTFTRDRRCHLATEPQFELSRKPRQGEPATALARRSRR